MSGPGRELRLKALERANDVRLRRSGFFAQLRGCSEREARSMLAAALIAAPEWLEGADIAIALCQIPRVGRKTAWGLLQMIDVHQRRSIRELTERQRRLLANLLIHGTGR